MYSTKDIQKLVDEDIVESVELHKNVSHIMCRLLDCLRPEEINQLLKWLTRTYKEMQNDTGLYTHGNGLVMGSHIVAVKRYHDLYLNGSRVGTTWNLPNCKENNNGS